MCDGIKIGPIILDSVSMMTVVSSLCDTCILQFLYTIELELSATAGLFLNLQNVIFIMVPQSLLRYGCCLITDFHCSI